MVHVNALRREVQARPARRLGSRDGQAMAEFAIVMPILLILVFGIIEMSNAWRTHQVVTNLTREGARNAILPNAAENTIRSDILASFTAQGLNAPDTIIIQCAGADGLCATTGQETLVRTEYAFTFRLLGPLVTWACGTGCAQSFGTVTIGSTTVMRKE
jgi:Flp pilus assembly protein TadG